MSAGFRAGQANDGYLQINGTDILTVSSGVLGVKNTGAQSEVRLYCESNNAHYASLKSPPHSDFIGNVTFTLPGTSGSSGQVLQTDGSGNLSWVNNSGGGGGGGVSDKMSEGNTEAEVVDTGSDGHFKVTTEGVERLRITSSGDVGINITNPVQALYVRSASSAQYTAIAADTSNATGGGVFDAMQNGTRKGVFGISGWLNSNTDDDPMLYTVSGKNLRFYVGGTTERFRITSAGELVSTNGTLRRDVSTSSFTVTGDTASNTGANINLYGASHSSLANIFRVRTGATERLRVGPSGQIGLGGANYGTSGQVLTSGGASGAVSWTTISGGGGGSYGNSDVDNHLNSGGASSGQILSWNGSDYAWVADQGGSGGGGISDLVDDTTPQLGGNLDLNSNNITGTGTIPAANLIGTLPAISGASLTTLNASELDSGTIPDARFPATLPAASGANLTNLPAANITGTLPAISGANLTNLPGISNVVEDTSPQLGGNLNVNGSDIISTGNGDIDFTPNGTGAVVFKGVSSNGGNGAGRFKLNCENNSHGITIQGPPHSAAANYTLTLPNNDGSSGEYLKSDGSGNLSWSNPLIYNGNVGIGIDPTFPIYSGTNDRTLILGTGSEDSAIQIHSGGSSYGGLYFGDSTSGNARYMGYVEFKHGTNDDFLRFGTDAQERLRIDSDGDVNIGPSANANGHGLLTLSQSATAAFNALVIQQGNTLFTATDGLQIGIDAGVHAYIKQYENRDIYFTTGNPNTEKLRITSDGNIGLNETDPYYKFHMVFSNATTSLSGGGSGAWGSDGIRIENTNTTVGSMSLAHFRNYDADWHIGSKYVAANNSSFIFSSEGNERLHIKSNGDVGIGVNPECRLHVEENLSHSSTYYLNADAHIMVDNPGSGKSVLKLEGEAALVYGGGSSSLIFADRQNERMRIHSSGKISVGSNTNVSYGNFQVNQNAANDESGIGILSNNQARSMRLYCDNSSNSIINSGDGGAGVLKLNEGAGQVRIGTGGLTFNGDTAAANALDDYEEGTYDPTVTPATGTITVNSTYNTLSYTKIGRLVTISGQIRIQSTSSPSGNTVISLPFTVTSSIDKGRSGGALYLYNHSLGSLQHYKVVPYVVTENTTDLRLQNYHFEGGYQLEASDEISFDVTYVAAS